MAINITLTDRKLFTLNPDGSDLVQLQDPNEFNKNVIGERKRIELSYNSSVALANSKVYFDPALFLKSGSSTPAPYAPFQSWNYFISNIVPPGTYDMVLEFPGPYAEGLLKNWKAQIQIIDDNNFKIIFEYYQLYDLLGYLNVANETNRLKLLSRTLFDPAGDTEALYDVYQSSNVVPQFYVFIANLTTEETGYNNTVISQYRAGFYNFGPTNSAPYFTLPVWELTVDDQVVTSLPLADDTKVKFKITAPGVVDKIFIWMIKSNSNDQSVDFITNYDASYLNITTDNSTNTLHNKIKAPSIEPTLESGKYEVSFHVDKTKLAFGDQYRFIAVVYESGYGGVDVNSFISGTYEVALPQFTGQGYDFEGSIEDIVNKYYGNELTAVSEERIKSNVSLNFDYNAFSDDILNRLGLTVPNDIRRYLTQVMVEIYEEDGLYVNYFDRQTASKIDPVNYSVPNGMALNFGADSLDVSYTFRNRYESDIENLSSFYNGLPIAPATTQDWTGKNLFIRWFLTLEYDDYTTPFSDSLVFVQKLYVKPLSSEVTILKADDSPIEDTTYFCTTDSVCLKAKLTGVDDPSEYLLVVNVEQTPGSSLLIEENEEFDKDSSSLPQLETAKVFTQDVRFDINGEADFCLNPVNFFLNLPYKISAIAKLDMPCVRITEEDFLRLEEDDEEIRIIENC